MVPPLQPNCAAVRALNTLMERLQVAFPLSARHHRLALSSGLMPFIQLELQPSLACVLVLVSMCIGAVIFEFVTFVISFMSRFAI